MGVSAGALARIFDAEERRSGIIGLAIGLKEVDRRVESDAPESITFFVPVKQPRVGKRRTVRGGKRLLPRKMAVGSDLFHTDVVEPLVDPPPEAHARLQQTRFTAGGPVANLGGIGTFGALVRKWGSPYLYALTNRHVALDPGNIVYFPHPNGTNPIRAATRWAAGLVSDDNFWAVSDEPNTYFDVDAALVQVPHPRRALFSERIPTLGIPSSIYRPDHSSVETFRASLLGLPVASWSWNSGLRRGQVSHVLYTTRPAAHGPTVVYSFLVRGDGVVPGIPRDSGKVWVTPGSSGLPSLLGLHQGVVGSLAGESGSRFAVATEVFSLSRLLRFSPV